MKPGDFDRRLLRRRHETLASDVSLLASEFPGGFQTVEGYAQRAVLSFAPGASATQQQQAQQLRICLASFR